MDLKFFDSSNFVQGKHNIFIGICLGVLKPLTLDMAKEYVAWALKNTNGKVAILIADEIAKYNYQVFSRYSPGKAEKRALREGDKYAEFFKEVLEGFSSDERSKIVILRWKDIFSDRLATIKKVLELEYKDNVKFRMSVQGFINRYADRRGKTLTVEQLDVLSHYILLELPTLLEGIEFQGSGYDLLLYPTFVDSGMSQMIVDIQEGRLFKDLAEKLDLTKKTVLVESYIPVD